MKTGRRLGILLAAMLVTTSAVADDQECLNAVSKGQRFKNSHKLVEARDQLRICAAPACPAVVQSDCADWLAEVEKALPSVVLTAKDDSGADLVDVKVSMDSRLLVTRLDGQALPTNAGPHTFRFERVDGASIEQQALVKEGEKNHEVSARFRTTSGDSSGPWRTMGWVLGGLGVAGLGVGAVFGVIALVDKSDAHCNATVCDPGTTGNIKSAALASDIGWSAGGLLLASGAALVLFARSGHEAVARVSVAPVAAPGGGGVTLGGMWW
jgi:hypothetical protein